jgi:hypothetical protein
VAVEPFAVSICNCHACQRDQIRDEPGFKEVVA